MLERSDGWLRGRRAATGAFWVLGVAMLAGGLGCATARVSNLDAYDEVPMNQVIPYPSKDEMRKRAFEVVIVDRPAVGIDAELLDKPRAQVRRALESISAEAGASVVDRSPQATSEDWTEEMLDELEGREGEDVSDADFALSTRFSTYAYTAAFKKPFKFLWQSPEDIAGKPGTCTHTAEVELDVQLIEIGSNDRVTRTYALEHSATLKNKDLDPACTIAPVTLGVLFERALDESLGCLKMPLATRLSPRGHLTQHRKAAEPDRHIYRITLGSAQGIEKGDRVEIRREQHSMSATTGEARSERLIGVGEVTDQVMAQVAWIAADPADMREEVLDGDVVRPLLSQGLLSSLSGPDCAAILTER